jgi:glyoxylase-like metal-dependent hydrolase (beta-lactamase superfamily II)
MDVRSYYETDSGTWTHLLADLASGSAAVIDPVWVYDPVSGCTDSGFIDRILEDAEQAAYRVDWVLETHAHADHLTAAAEVKRATGARVACGRGICAVQENFARAFDMRGVATDGSQFDRLLVEGDVIELGELEVRVIETPGHTADSLTYLAGNAAFIGDTLFAPSFGTARCDFPGGDAEQLFDSIGRLYELPESTRLYLCHDYPEEPRDPVSWVTVGESRQSNAHVRAGTRREEFVAMRRERDGQLGLPRLILPALQVNILAGEAPEPNANGVSYLRIPLDRSLQELIRAG